MEGERHEGEETNQLMGEGRKEGRKDGRKEGRILADHSAAKLM